MHPLAQLDHRHVWHPFTQMQDWLRTEPRVIVSGRGATLRDAHGHSYLDANASIWTNLHGHRQPDLNRALRRQLNRIAHSSALGLAGEPSSQLAAQLIHAARLPRRPPSPQPRLTKVFYSDNGSTALEVALKLAWEYTRRSRGIAHPRFLSLQGAYHGDTIGAVALGHIDLFHRAYGGLLFRTDAVMAPYCYRCPYNRASPQPADARTYRQCRWECIDHVEQSLHRAQSQKRPYAAFVVEPRLQGAAGILPQPDGWLQRTATLARAHGALLIADEVMTGFGRTGLGPARKNWLFASHHEAVQPDFLCLAKGLSGGYLPLAATLTTQPVFDAFLGDYAEFKTFFHGHSFTGNALGCASGLASLELLQDPQRIDHRATLESLLSLELQDLWNLPAVGDIRQVGLVAGIELVAHRPTRQPYPLEAQTGFRVAEAMARRGVLTRPVGNVLVLMPPYCTTPNQLKRMVRTLALAIDEITTPSLHR
jgi:adenosylmethionine-8-amino-7-oxononanoate aminotransferase